MNNKQKGNEGEKFVADYLSGLGFVVEIHPRTFRRIFVKGKELYISQDNDYHNCFDIKAEGVEQMIYAQVKWFPKHAIDSGNVSKGRIKIDKAYPYTFPYIRVQVWMVWKEWVSHPRRHKEFRKRIWERHGYHEDIVRGIHVFRGTWEEITPPELTEPSLPEIPDTSMTNSIPDNSETPEINSKLPTNKNRKAKP